MYFKHRGETLGLDQGLQWALQQRLSMDVAQAVYDRCHEFQEHDSGDLGSAGNGCGAASRPG